MFYLTRARGKTKNGTEFRTQELLFSPVAEKIRLRKFQDSSGSFCRRTFVITRTKLYLDDCSKSFGIASYLEVLSFCVKYYKMCFWVRRKMSDNHTVRSLSQKEIPDSVYYGTSRYRIHLGLHIELYFSCFLSCLSFWAGVAVSQTEITQLKHTRFLVIYKYIFHSQAKIALTMDVIFLESCFAATCVFPNPRLLMLIFDNSVFFVRIFLFTALLQLL